MAKVHLQNVADYTSHTLTLRRDKAAAAAAAAANANAKGISTELPGAKSIYICDGELFKQLDGEPPRGSGEGTDTGGGGGGGGPGNNQGYVILPTNNSGTLKPSKGKEDPAAKYNLSIEQLPQSRLVHLANSAGTDGVPGFGLKSLPADQVSVSCTERDSPMHNLHNMGHNVCGDGGGDGGNVMSKGENISTLSMSSLEVSPERGREAVSTPIRMSRITLSRCHKNHVFKTPSSFLITV